MADAEAVARIIRAGGEATRTVSNLGREARQATVSLDELERRIARTAAKREALNDSIARGELTPMSPQVRGVAAELAALRSQYAQRVPPGVYRPAVEQPTHAAVKAERPTATAVIARAPVTPTPLRAQTVPASALPVTDRPGFKQWFGQSKAIDEQGKPLVAYHGSKRDIRAFAPSEAQTVPGAYFFTTNSEYASAEAGKRIGGNNVMPVHLSLQNPKDVDYEGKTWDGDSKQIEEAKAAGHDSLIRRNMTSMLRPGMKFDEYVAFDPTQIKSVFAQRFDQNDPNISGMPVPEGSAPLERQADPTRAAPIRTGFEPLSATELQARLEAAEHRRAELQAVPAGVTGGTRGAPYRGVMAEIAALRAEMVNRAEIAKPATGIPVQPEPVTHDPPPNGQTHRDDTWKRPVQALRAFRESQKQAPATMSSETRAAAERNYTPEEIARARELRPGTILIPQPEPLAAAERPPQPIPGGKGLPLGAGLMPGARTAQQERDDEEVDHELKERAALQHKLREEERLNGLSTKDLSNEWKRSQTDLRGVDRDLDRVINQYQRLRDVQTPHAAGRRAELMGQRREYQQSRAGFQEEQDAIRRAGERKGMRLDERGNLVGGGGGGGNAIQAFLGGAGFGGGGFSGLVAGTLLGSLTPLNAVAAAVGLAIGKSIEMGREGYRNRIGVLHEQLPLAAMMGLPPRTAEETMMRTARTGRESNIYLPHEVRAAQEIRLRGLGTWDTRGVMTAATLSGRGMPEQAQADVALGALGRRLELHASLRALAAYQRSAMAPRARGGLGVAFNFLPQFESLIPALLQSGGSPFTRDMDVSTAMGQAAAASNLDLGIDSPLARGQVGAAMLGARNQGMSGFGSSSGPLAQLSMLAMLKLNDTKSAAWKARLKKATGGADIETLPGRLELIQRAPKLVRQFPELSRGIFGAIKEYYPDQTAMQFALVDAAQGNWTLTREWASGNLERAAEAPPAPEHLRPQSPRDATRARLHAAHARSRHHVREAALQAMRDLRNPQPRAKWEFSLTTMGGADLNTTVPPVELAPLSLEERHDRARQIRRQRNVAIEPVLDLSPEEAEARRIQESAPAKAYGQFATVPEAQSLEMGHAIGESIGDRLMPIWNTLPQMLNDTLTALLVRDVPGTPACAMNIRQTIFYILDHPRIGAAAIPQCIDAQQLLHAPLPQPRPLLRRTDTAAGIPSGLPVPGILAHLSTPHGYFHAPRRGHIHQGIDLASPEGTPVHATAAGRVIGAEWHQGYGVTVLIDHGGGMATRYAHLENATVTMGQRVDRGDVIGHVGDTGNARGFFHLHYEVLRNRTAVDPEGFV